MLFEQTHMLQIVWSSAMFNTRNPAALLSVGIESSLPHDAD